MRLPADLLVRMIPVVLSKASFEKDLHNFGARMYCRLRSCFLGNSLFQELPRTAAPFSPLTPRRSHKTLEP